MLYVLLYISVNYNFITSDKYLQAAVISCVVSAATLTR